MLDKAGHGNGGAECGPADRPVAMTAVTASGPMLRWRDWARPGTPREASSEVESPQALANPVAGRAVCCGRSRTPPVVVGEVRGHLQGAVCVGGVGSDPLAGQVLVEVEQVEVVDGSRVDRLLHGSALEQALHRNLDALPGEGVRDAGHLDDLVGDVAG